MRFLLWTSCPIVRGVYQVQYKLSTPHILNYPVLSFLWLAENDALTHGPRVHPRVQDAYGKKGRVKKISRRAENKEILNPVPEQCSVIHDRVKENLTPYVLSGQKKSPTHSGNNDQDLHLKLLDRLPPDHIIRLVIGSHVSALLINEVHPAEGNRPTLINSISLKNMQSA